MNKANNRNFRSLLEGRWSRSNFVCVGLDPVLEHIPAAIRNSSDVGSTISTFTTGIVDATHDLVSAYKPNIAFYEQYGAAGLYALSATIRHIHKVAPEVPVILDAKRADIGNTSEAYARMIFDVFGADASTVSPYLGREALASFLDRKNQGVIVLCRTSNPGAGEFQNLLIRTDYTDHDERGTHMPLYQYVALQVMRYWNVNGNCALVVGATYPNELRDVRSIVGDMTILIPGVGTQGGHVEKIVTAGKNSRGEGMIISSSGAIIYASAGPDFAGAARRETIKLRDAINRHR